MLKRNYLLVILLMLFMLGCGDEELPKPDLEKPVAVKTVQVKIQPVQERLSYAGTVQPIEKVRLSTKIMGWVEAIYYEEGDKVQKGATLVKLRSEELDAKRAQAEAAMAEADAQFKNASINLKRIESLFEKKAATQKELDDMRTAFTSAQARKKAAQEMKKEVEGLLLYTALTAPFDGVVARKMIEVGDLANPGQPIMAVEDMSQVKIVAKVPEKEIQNFKVGGPAIVQVQASDTGTNGQHYEGVIHQIVPAADPVSRQFEVKVLLDHPDQTIKSGMFARIFIGKSGRTTLLVPRETVFRRGQLQGLFVVDSENKARLRWIRTGTRYGNQIEILSGLNPGELVVTEGASLLLDGQTVEVTP
jgi:RND family efflux transporter MFP subunit